LNREGAERDPQHQQSIMGDELGSKAYITALLNYAPHSGHPVTTMYRTMEG